MGPQVSGPSWPVPSMKRSRPSAQPLPFCVCIRQGGQAPGGAGALGANSVPVLGADTQSPLLGGQSPGRREHGLGRDSRSGAKGCQAPQLRQKGNGLAVRKGQTSCGTSTLLNPVRQLSESTRPFSLDIGPPKCEKKQTAEWQSAIGQPYCEFLNLTAMPMLFLSVDAVKCKSENEKDTCQVYDCGGLGWGRGVFP